MSLEQQVETAADKLRRGEVVAIPTETVYGLAGAISDPAAIARIFSLKERPFFDPLIVHIADRSWLPQVVRQVPHAAELLMDHFWPGPLTIVLPRRHDLNSMISSGLDTVGVRLPSHPVALELLRAVGIPLAAPSANKFGRTSPTTAEHVRAEWPGGEVMVVDGGAAEVGVESTVVRVNEGSEVVVEVLRPGGVAAESMAEVLKAAGLKAVVRRVESDASPGHLDHHYMPAVPLFLLEADEVAIAERQGVDGKTATIMRLSADPVLAARELYSEMRRAAESGAEAIVCPIPARRDGLWAAIWDRLSRAAQR